MSSLGTSCLLSRSEESATLYTRRVVQSGDDHSTSIVRQYDDDEPLRLSNLLVSDDVQPWTTRSYTEHFANRFEHDRTRPSHYRPTIRRSEPWGKGPQLASRARPVDDHNALLALAEAIFTRQRIWLKSIRI